MPHYHLSLTTDQPVAIKTRIATRSISNDSARSGANPGGEAELRDTPATAGELNAAVQLLQIQMQNLERHLELILKFYEEQGLKRESPFTAQGFWRKLGARLRLAPRRSDQRLPDKSVSD